MEKQKKRYSYAEWLSADEMHRASLNWLSELHFCADEQTFLNGLVKSYTPQLTDKNIFGESKKLVKELLDLEKQLVKLANQVQAHERLLQIMVDDIDQIKMEKAYVETHNDLTYNIHQYLVVYRDIKKRMFSLLSGIMKSQKQKRLLN
ncbi:hypothetical protein [Flagellimonas pacifica]|uniref:Uncharacterized protein n=1 Tax=Flagellimonas pacifica TaxID=1247520 RepID=A0A285MU83_9FLAO|nr:hypothetical protein [Allomuricauda parva]SNZ00734.1 hypothetical protein SAMN06265377_2560 [Allomuricauda parva]